MATIMDVAKAAGVSRTTVSRVINKHPYVNEEKRRLIIETMSRLGYEPSRVATQLRVRQTNLVAVLVSRIAIPIFSEMIAGMEMIAAEHSYQLIICQTGNSKEKEWEYLRLLVKKQVDGIITTTMHQSYSELEEILNHGPIVVCNEHVDMDIPSVRIDNEEAAYVATRHLLELGHRNIVCCVGSILGMNERRKSGYKRAMKEYSIEVNEDLVIDNCKTISDGERIVESITKLAPLPTAAFVTSDEVAAGVIKAAKKMGIKVPEDLSVIGFYDQEIATIIEPNLTTVHQPILEMGKKAMEVMVQRLNGKEPAVRTTIMPTQLVIRESTVGV